MRGMNDRIIPTTDATAGGRGGDYDHREAPFYGESKPDEKPKKPGIVAKIKGIWFKWKE